MIEPVTSYTEALGPIRERVGKVLKIRYEDFDHLCGFAQGLSGKVFGRSEVRRFGIEKFFDAIRGAGLRIRFEEDPEQTARMLERIAENYNPRQANQARPNNHANPSAKVVESVLSYLVKKKGGLTILNDAVKMARSHRGREGWKTRRKGGVVDFTEYLENISRLTNAPALPEFVEQESASQNACSAEANAA